MRSLFFLFSIFLLLCPLSGQNWYRSNPLGMQLERTDSPLDQGWELFHYRRGNLEERILFLDGQEEKKWTREELEDGGVLESRWVGDRKVSVILWDKEGRLWEEWIDPQEENFNIHRKYSYPEENLHIREWLNSEGEPFLIDRIRLRKDGSLLSIRRNGYVESWSDRDLSSSFMAADWLKRDKSGEITYYDNEGRPERILRLEDEERISETIHRYGSGGLIGLTTIQNYREDRKILREFNEKGLLSQEEIYRENRLVSRSTFRYTEDQLTEKILEGEGPAERWLYQYRDGTLEQEEYYLGGRLIRRIDHQEGHIE